MWITHLVILLNSQSMCKKERGEEEINMYLCRNNVMGTHILLEAAKLHKIIRFIHMSTDEVYGEVLHGVMQ